MKKTILSKKKIEQLLFQAKHGLKAMEENAEKFTGNAREIWNSHFNWTEDVFEFDTAGHGDCGIPEYCDGWKDYTYETQVKRTKGKMERLRLYWQDKDGEEETELEMTKTELKEKCLQRELIGFMIKRHCTYTLLSQCVYMLDCIDTGKDPLGWVYPVSEKISCTVDVTVFANNKSQCIMVSGDKRAYKKAVETVVSPRRKTRDDFLFLEDVVKKNPRGRQGTYLSWECKSYIPGDSITLRVNRHITVTTHTARHIRETFSRDVEKQVTDYVREIAKTLSPEEAP